MGRKKKHALPGQRYGTLTVLGEAGYPWPGSRHVYCRCDCGRMRQVYVYYLSSGITRSCDHEPCTTRGESRRKYARAARQRKEEGGVQND